jgi:hypothetical protein
MRKLVQSGAEIDLDPVIDEGLAALPFIRPEAIETFRDHFIGKGTLKGGRLGGTRITPNERVELGLEKWAGDQHISWEVWNALTDEARRNPAGNFDDLCNRIIRNSWRIADRQKDNAFLKSGWPFVFARFMADHRDPCHVAKVTDRAMWKEIPEIPFGSCAKRVCGCTWRLLTERDLAREQGRPLPAVSENVVVEVDLTSREEPPGMRPSPIKALGFSARGIIMSVGLLAILYLLFAR